MPLQSSTRRQHANDHGDLLQRETCQCRREHANVSKEPKKTTIRLPAPRRNRTHGPTALHRQSPTHRHHDCQHVAPLGGISTPLNNAPNFASPHKGDHPTKRGGERKVSLSRLGWCFVASVTATLASGSQKNAEYHNECFCHYSHLAGHWEQCGNGWRWDMPWLQEPMATRMVDWGWAACCVEVSATASLGPH